MKFFDLKIHKTDKANPVKIAIFFLMLVVPCNIFCQNEKPKGIDAVQEVDTVQNQFSEIELSEVQLFKKIKFKNSYDRAFYIWYRKKTLKAYPFAVMAAEELSGVEKELDSMKSKKTKRRHKKKAHDKAKEKFEDQLKKLTRTEGRILIKLIHRQTGETAYELVKRLRNGWKAYWYQRIAKIHKLSLKDTFDPTSSFKDYVIEDVLQRAFLEEKIEENPSKLTFDYFKLSKKYAKKLH